MKNTIEQKLTRKFLPMYIEVCDESHLHAGHAGVAERGGQHFSLMMVSSAFDGKNQVQRQRLVYGELSFEMKNINRSGIHALRMQLLTPAEWSDSLMQPIVSQ